MKCGRCGDQLRFERGRGWVHSDGGTYMMRCGECGWMGARYPSPVSCPGCGSLKLRDDHCVMPVDEGTGGVVSSVYDRKEIGQWKGQE